MYPIIDANDIHGGPVGMVDIPMPVMEKVWGNNDHHIRSLLENTDKESQKFIVDLTRFHDLVISAAQAVNGVYRTDRNNRHNTLDAVICNFDNMIGLIMNKAFKKIGGFDDQSKIDALLSPLNEEYYLTHFDDNGNEIRGQWNPIKKGNSFTSFYLFNINHRVSGYDDATHEHLVSEAYTAEEVITWMMDVLEDNYLGTLEPANDQVNVINIFSETYKEIRESPNFRDFRHNPRDLISELS